MWRECWLGACERREAWVCLGVRAPLCSAHPELSPSPAPQVESAQHEVDHMAAATRHAELGRVSQHLHLARKSASLARRSVSQSVSGSSSSLYLS